jgi:hypothetical protein
MGRQSKKAETLEAVHAIVNAACDLAHYAIQDPTSEASVEINRFMSALWQCAARVDFAFVQRAIEHSRELAIAATKLEESRNENEATQAAADEPPVH